MPATTEPLGLPVPGDVLAGKYEITKLLGRGGMGAVFKADHKLLNQPVAIKLLLTELGSNADLVRRFENEARAAARIESEHVVSVKDLGVLDSGMPFIVLEYLDGQDLSQLLRERQRITIPEAADFVIQAIDALAQAHAAGIVHRDLKPANLFITKRRDGSQLVKVLDFGISKSTTPLAPDSAALTQTQATLGSPYYMSPEQVRSSRSVTSSADIWALGAILHEALTGNPPHEGTSMGELFAAILERDVQSLRTWRPDLPPEFDAAVLRCLRRDPAQRFANVAELALALAPYATPRATRLLDRICAAQPRTGESRVSPHASSIYRAPGSGVALPMSGTGSAAATGPYSAANAAFVPPQASTGAAWGQTSSTRLSATTEPRGAKFVVPVMIVAALVLVGGGVTIVKVIASHTTPAASGAPVASIAAPAAALTPPSKDSAEPAPTIAPPPAVAVAPTAPPTVSPSPTPMIANGIDAKGSTHKSKSGTTASTASPQAATTPPQSAPAPSPARANASPASLDALGGRR